MLLWVMMAFGGGALKVEQRQLLIQTQKQEPLDGRTNKRQSVFKSKKTCHNNILHYPL